MPIWKNAATVFTGGTEQIQLLKGRRVRCKTRLQLNLYDPINNKQETAIIAPSSIGIIANHHPTQFCLLIAFDMRPSSTAITLEAIMRGGNFKVFMVNDPTFKMQFEVES